MGLAIAKGIVEAHGGRIRIAGATAHQGCRVTVTLPIGDHGVAHPGIETPLENDAQLESVAQADTEGDERQATHSDR
jgi:hypothetical protein